MIFRFYAVSVRGRPGTEAALRPILLKLVTHTVDNTRLFWFYFCSHISVLLLCVDKQDKCPPPQRHRENTESCSVVWLSCKRSAGQIGVRCAEFWRRDPGLPGPDETGGASRPVGDAVRMHVAEEESSDRKTHTSGIHEGETVMQKCRSFFFNHYAL